MRSAFDSTNSFRVAQEQKSVDAKIVSMKNEVSQFRAKIYHSIMFKFYLKLNYQFIFGREKKSAAPVSNPNHTDSLLVLRPYRPKQLRQCHRWYYVFNLYPILGFILKRAVLFLLRCRNRDPGKPRFYQWNIKFLNSEPRSANKTSLYQVQLAIASLKIQLVSPWHSINMLHY